MAASPLNTLSENAPVISEAPWNKPVDCVHLGVSVAWWLSVVDFLRLPFDFLSRLFEEGRR